MKKLVAILAGSALALTMLVSPVSAAHRNWTCVTSYPSFTLDDGDGGTVTFPAYSETDIYPANLSGTVDYGFVIITIACH